MGETPLDYAAKQGADNLVAVLVGGRGGAEKPQTPRGPGNKRIIKLLGTLNASGISTESIHLNGTETTLQQLLEYKKICSDIVEELFKSNASTRPSTKIRLKEKIHRTCFTLSALDLNIKLFSEKIDLRETISGTIKRGSLLVETKHWARVLYELRGGNLYVFSSTRKHENEVPDKFPLQNTRLTFEVFYSDPSRFTIIYHNELEDVRGLYFLSKTNFFCAQLKYHQHFQCIHLVRKVAELNTAVNISMISANLLSLQKWIIPIFLKMAHSAG